MILNSAPIDTGKGGELSPADLDNFRTQFHGTILTAADEDYHAKRQVWNKMIDRKPGIIARCTGVADVIQAVNFARKHQLLVAVRGGGHSGGVVSDTGVGGLTLNGGLSWMRRKAGMSIDNLLGANLVLADGSFVHCSKVENADLFWAIRGGGGNFGIVTSFEFRLQELGPEVMFVACMYPRAEARKVMKFWVDFTSKATNEITSDCIHWAIPAHPAFPEALHNQPVTVLAAMYAGPAEEGKKALQPLREVTEPVLDLSNVYPYQAVQQMFDPFLQKNTLQSYWKSIYVDGLPEETCDQIIDWASPLPVPESLISIRHLGGALSDIPASATAFGDRSGQYLVSIDSMWRNAKDDEANIQWTRDFFNDLHRETNGQVYFNFTFDLVGAGDIMADSYGENYERLVAIKTKYDPENFFRLNANIKPAAEAV